MNPKQLGELGKALSDENRATIVDALGKRGSMTCIEVQELVKLSQPTVSHHINTLIDAGLVNGEKDGRCLRLSLNPIAGKQLKNLAELFKGSD